ncbi:hypothetical protein A2246_06360 [candidate division WOR-1 bacterium RIFOXYA2_FULL_37_7]|nr:MAG: hypothetical protein A2246_06360 [candidate division WOR-1 bacterium RIFOXYA2_FULL_37_7]
MAEQINPIVPLTPTQEAIAGSAKAIFTAADREMIRNRVGDRVGDFYTTRNFVDIAKDMMDKALMIDRAETDIQESLPHENATTRITLEKRLIKHSPLLNPQDRPFISNEEIKPEDKFGKEDEESLHEYAVLYGQKLLGISINFEELIILENKIDPTTITSIQINAEQAIESLLLKFLKEEITNKFKDLKLASYIVLKANKPQILLDYYAEKITLKLSGLIGLLKDLEITEGALKRLYNRETVFLTNNVIKIKDMELKKKTEIQHMEDELKNKFVKELMADNLFERYKSSIEISFIKRKLLSLQTNLQRIESILYDAKRIAWLKSIVVLKELHLTRVLSETKKAFEALTHKINAYTGRTRELGLHISREGAKWIETKLEDMALQAAKYKIELLKSMQTLSYEANREKDIKWLSEIFENLKNT